MTPRSAESGSRTSEERCLRLLEGLAEEVSVYSAVRDDAGEIVDWRLVDANALARRAIGEDAIGRLASALLGPLVVMHLPVSREVMRSRTPATVEATLPPGGRHYRASLVPLDDSTLAVAAVDVTNLKREEEARGAREAWFRAVVETVPHMLWVGGPAGENVYNNARLLAFTGRTSAELAGDGWRQTIHPDDLPEAVAYWAAAMASGRAGTQLTRVRRHDGAYRFCRVAAEPLRDEEGRIVRWIGTWTDVDDQIRAGEALAEGDRRKGDFLAVLSHELRNPLAAMRNALRLLERSPVGSAPAGNAREVLRRQTDHLVRLVDDLLDLTRISRGKVELQRAPVDLREVLHSACEDLRFTFDEGRIALRVDLAPAPVWVDGDETRLAQIVDNLLVNAAKFTAPGGTVTASVAGTEAGAELRVGDDGPGIPPEELPRVFEPFAQGKPRSSRAPPGLGLGLALVRSLAELHGGTARVESVGRGRGATFVVELPLGEAPRTRRPVATALTVRAAAGAGIRSVLVIEDHPDAGATLVEALSLDGHRVALAPDGRSGLALARELRPDVVLCDIGLPDMSGYDVARALRADAATRPALLVALTGYAQPEDRERARAAGFDAHLAKPARLEEVDALLAAPPRRR